MRITDALKPVTDALAAAGMSLDTATYKDGKIHATLSTEAPKVTGKPGSGPEYPPEGYRLVEVLPPGTSGALVWLTGNDKWDTVLPGRFYVLGHVQAIAVPIAPKPEPVKLSDQEKIVGWRGPTGFRLQTFQNRSVECVTCKKTIKAGERLARWRVKFPETGDRDHTCGHPSNEENRAHAHVDCLYKNRYAAAEMYHQDHLFRDASSNVERIHIRGAWATAAMSFAGAPMRQLDYAEHDVPKWLKEKREKYDAQQSTP